METMLAENLNDNQLGLSLELAKDIITKDYLYKLEDYEVAELPEELKELEIDDYARFFKFTKMVSDKKESVIDKLVTVLNAAYSSNATIVTLITGHKEYAEYYLGVVSKDIEQKRENIGTQGETLKGVLTGNFPGLEIEPISGKKKTDLFNNAFVYDYMTSISGIASVRNEKDNSYEKYVQGIEHLVDALDGKEYSIIVIADPINAQELSDAKLGYEALYTQLSPFCKTTVNFNETESITVTQNHTEGITNTIGHSTALTQNYTKTSGWSESSSHGTSRNKDTGHLVGATIGAGVGIAATVLTGGLAAPVVAAAAYVGSQVGSKVGGAFIGSKGTNNNETSSESGSATESSGKTDTKNESEARQASDTTGESEATSRGQSLQFSSENKVVRSLLDKIDKHIERLTKCESYGAFNCATYVISSDPETNAIVSSGYNALMRGDSSALQASHINNWSVKDSNGKKIKEYLLKFSHPRFINPVNNEVLLSPASISNSYELAVSMGLPKKSLNGLPVFEMASFGRNVFEDGSTNNSIDLGSVFHMGAPLKTKVNLNVKSLSMHTFISGSTGAGKSNTVYQIIRELKKKKIHYLVIEPAKGEYKHVFGNDGTFVYGTNPYKSPLLQINPFRFPKDIHVLEHLDRLVEIFNVCWPMYAAMPAVLKESIENAYIKAGWNLTTSENVYSDQLFPTFEDVLIELDRVVSASAFSQEVKDNYIGSLATRIRSLTNGIYGQIFNNDELGDCSLFDNDVIVDLSRVGSTETKALIMGILVMRLQEYRMTQGFINSDLKHVTVLEEAHHLLKRTSTEQSNESSNLVGKSVEMISNAIADVRTYGEGFVIVDQAPGLLDMSVIRNTNTKIIMRLPDAEDRTLVGKSANLSDEQIKELAKIPTGVAAVYQNNWLEPVLCKVNYEELKDERYKWKLDSDIIDRSLEKTVLLNLLDKVAGEHMDLDMDETLMTIIKSSIPTQAKTDAIRAMKKNGVIPIEDISSAVYNIVVSPDVEIAAEKTESIEDWKNMLVYSSNSPISDLSEEQQNRVIECVLREQIENHGKPPEYLDTWHRFINGEVV